MAIGAIAAAAIPSLIKAGTSIWQTSQAQKLASQYIQPTFTVPQGMLDALDMSKNMALQQGLPRQDLIESSLGESTANILEDLRSTATNPWDYAGSAQRVYETQQENIKDIGIAGAQAKIGNQERYMNLLESLAAIQERQFAYNEYNPYLAAMDAVKNLRYSSTMNLFSGISDISGIAAHSIGTGGNEQKVNQAYGRVNELIKGAEASLRYNPSDFE